jgi:hemolysin III
MSYSWFVPMSDLPVWFEGEETVNSMSHWPGVILSIVGTWVVMKGAMATESTNRMIGCSIFCVSMLNTFVTSSLYHAVTDRTWKIVFRYFDYLSIYFLIAGSYTPFLLKSRMSKTFSFVWAVAVIGLIATVLRFDDFQKYSLLYFVMMGWLALPVLGTLFKRWSRRTVGWILTAGGSYTVGAYFYSRLWLYAHAIWHLFVIAGSFSTVMAIHYDH